MYNLLLIFSLLLPTNIKHPVEFTIDGFTSLQECEDYYKGYEDKSISYYVKGYFKFPIESNLTYISRSCEKDSI